MDIESAFTFVFDDEDWIKKIAIGGAVFIAALILSPVLIGLILFLPLSGYMLEVIKNVRDGQARPLPEWSDFGGLLRTGFFVAVIYFVYNIPALIFACAAGVTQALPTITEIDADTAGSIALVAICLNCVQIVLSLAGNLLVPAALIRYAQFETMGSAFQFGEIFSFISSNIGDYLIAIILSWVASVIATFGVILCIVGVFFTSFYAILVSANLYGQLARKAYGSEQPLV